MNGAMVDAGAAAVSARGAGAAKAMATYTAE